MIFWWVLWMLILAGWLTTYEITAIQRLQKVFQQTTVNQKQNPKFKSYTESNIFLGKVMLVLGLVIQVEMVNLI
jgi:hypothetical protein